MSARRFTVFLLGEAVGELWGAGRGVSFCYGERALSYPSVLPLSLSLPKRAEPFGPEAALPEALEWAGREFGDATVPRRIAELLRRRLPTVGI